MKLKRAMFNAFEHHSECRRKQSRRATFLKVYYFNYKDAKFYL